MKAPTKIPTTAAASSFDNAQVGDKVYGGGYLYGKIIRREADGSWLIKLVQPYLTAFKVSTFRLTATKYANGASGVDIHWFIDRSWRV